MPNNRKKYELVNMRVIGCKKIGKRILIPKMCLVNYLESSRYDIKFYW